MNIAATKVRLVLTGLGVVAFSVVASLVATHVSFQISGTADYATTMMVAFIIPMLVAPPSYGFVAFLSWKLKKANERLDKLAHLDPLTALHNRRSFVDAATARLGSGSSQMLAMIDIDHFKKINDRIGHAGGDNALKHAAEVLRSSAPKEALLARLGGEEFGFAPDLQHPYTVRARSRHRPCSSRPCPASASSAATKSGGGSWFCNRANSRTSWLIFIEQNFGPHMLQKCAVFCAFGWQRLVVILLRCVGVERQVELVAPAEFEARLAERIVAHLCGGVAFGEVGRVGGELVGHNADLHIVAVGQAQMLLGRDVAEHRRAVPADHRRADAAGDMVISRRDVGGQRPKRVEGRFAAILQAAWSIFSLILCMGTWPGPSIITWHIMFPCAVGELAQRVQLGKLRFVIGVMRWSRGAGHRPG
jgi:hypothetical protein